MCSKRKSAGQQLSEWAKSEQLATRNWEVVRETGRVELGTGTDRWQVAPAGGIYWSMTFKIS